jgi:hypothetical protein
MNSTSADATNTQAVSPVSGTFAPPAQAREVAMHNNISAGT